MSEIDNTVAGGAISGRLRSEVRALHAQVDHHPLMAALIHPPLEKTDYIRALNALLGLQIGYEQSVVPLLPNAFESCRTQDILSDLLELGHLVDPLQEVWVCPCREGWLGVAYVFEGSRLGAKVIARLLAERVPNFPRKFFENGVDSARWYAYQQWLESTVRSEMNEEQVVASAKQTFQSILDYLDQVATG